MKPIELKESNGIKVGDTVYVLDLYHTKGATFILDGSTYKRSLEKIGVGKVLAIYDWDSDLSETPYLQGGNKDVIISGRREEDDEVIPFIVSEEEIING